MNEIKLAGVYHNSSVFQLNSMTEVGICVLPYEALHNPSELSYNCLACYKRVNDCW